MTLTTSSNDVVREIISHLPVADAVNFSETCTRINGLVYEVLVKRAGAKSVERYYADLKSALSQLKTLIAAKASLPEDVRRIYNRCLGKVPVTKEDAEELQDFLHYRNTLLVCKNLGIGNTDVSNAESIKEYENLYNSVLDAIEQYVLNHKDKALVSLTGCGLTAIPKVVDRFPVESLCLSGNHFPISHRELRSRFPDLKDVISDQNPPSWTLLDGDVEK